MSIRCQSWVYENSEARGNDRLVLLAIADEADDDGRNAHPGVDRIAHKARVNKRTTMRCIERLEEADALLVDRPEKRGRGYFNSYQVLMPKGDKVSPDERVTEGRVKARIGAQPYLNGSRPIDPLTHRPEGREAKSPRASSVPETFAVTPALAEWAEEKTPGVNLAVETEKFLDHHRSKGSKHSDWTAAWRNWMRRATEYAVVRNRNGNDHRQPGSGDVGGFADELPDFSDPYWGHPRDFVRPSEGG